MIDLFEALDAQYVVIEGMGKYAFATSASLEAVRLDRVDVCDGDKKYPKQYCDGDKERPYYFWAIYKAFAHYKGRQFDVYAYHIVDSLDEAIAMPAEELCKIKWEQEVDYLGFSFEFQHIFRSRRWHCGLH